MNAPGRAGLAFPPTEEAGWARVRAADPAAYARRRNYLDGPVTRLSPYLTHGLIDLPEAVHSLRLRHRPSALAKLEFEFAWREYFQHVWRHLGDGILADLRPPVSAAPYATALPADLVEARTGVRVIDESVRSLYGTGYLHNHQRMWLASYTVHLRKVHWRAGADWMLGYLLDGDLASNHLSWQWVAGTFSRKPYLCNNANVARYAPGLSSPGTALDTDYPALDRIARSATAAGPEPGAPAVGWVPPPLLARPPGQHPAAALPVVTGKRIALLHPWSLRRPPGADLAVGLVHAPFHQRFPWSGQRWAFVMDRLAGICDALWIGDGAELLSRLDGAASVAIQATRNPGYRDLWAGGRVRAEPVPRLLADPDPLCASFSRFWALVGGANRPKGERHGA